MAALTNKIIYIDAPTGLAGDMLLAALLDAGGNEGVMLSALARLNLQDWNMQIKRMTQGGLSALDVNISYEPQHQHRHLADIISMIEQASFPDRAAELAKKAFFVLAEAEAHAHGCSVDVVHFHEVGAIDSILDICGVALLIDDLGIEQAFCSPLPLSSGFVDCEHGRIPVPAPAAAWLLRGFDLAETDLKGELITPTGAALLRALETKNGFPGFELATVGCGAGKRKLPVSNIVRVFLSANETGGDIIHDEVDVITSNIDDASGEILASIWEKAFAEGALDVCYTPVFMKKGRPAWQLQIIAPPEKSAGLAQLIFTETGSLGCRISRERRIKARRSSIVVPTAFGEVAVVTSNANLAPEAESVRAAAAKHGIPFKQVYEAALAAAHKIHGGN